LWQGVAVDTNATITTITRASGMLRQMVAVVNGRADRLGLLAVARKTLHVPAPPTWQGVSVKERGPGLTAGFEVHTGKVLGLVTARRPAEVFTRFLDGSMPIFSPTRRSVPWLTPQHSPWTRPSPTARPLIPAACSSTTSLLHELVEPDRDVVPHAPPSALIRDGDVSPRRTWRHGCTPFATYNRLYAHPCRWTYTGDLLAA
jgi:hypothetical protein